MFITLVLPFHAILVALALGQGHSSNTYAADVT